MLSDEPNRAGENWDQYLYTFDNGYEVSVVRELSLLVIGQQREHDWEVGILKNGKFDNIAGITDTINRHINDERVDEILKIVNAMPTLNDKEDPDEVNIRKII